MAADPDIRFGTPAARWLLAATVGGSGIAFLDTTVVNVALPHIDEDLGGGSPACSGRSTPTSSP